MKFDIRYILIALGALSLISVTLYGVFGFRWWLPLQEYGDQRGFALFMLHVITGVIGAIAAFNKMVFP